MKIKKIERKTETYQVTKNFFVDVVETYANEEEWLEFWIYHHRYGIKEMMIGIAKKDIGTDGTWATIEDFILQDIEEEIEMYWEEHVRPDELFAEIVGKEF